MKSEQARVTEMHLTRQAKNGYAAVVILATLLRGPPKFLVGLATAVAVAGLVQILITIW